MTKPGDEKTKAAEKKKSSTRWQRIVVLPIAAKEGRDELTPGQYMHVKDEVKQLVGFGRRDFEYELRIAPFE